MDLPALRELQEVPVRAHITARYVNQNYGGPIYYEVIDGNFPPTMTLIRETGYITGYVPEMDDWVEEFKIALPEYTNDNYATAGSAALFDQSLTADYPETPYSYPKSYLSTFTVRAYNAYNENMYVDGEFYFRLLNNWSSDRDRFLRLYDIEHSIDGKIVNNLDYIIQMKELGYFD